MSYEMNTQNIHGTLFSTVNSIFLLKGYKLSKNFNNLKLRRFCNYLAEGTRELGSREFFKNEKYTVKRL